MHNYRPQAIIPAYMMATTIINTFISSPSSDRDAVSQAVTQLTQGYNATPTDDFIWSFWNTLLTKTIAALSESADTKFDPFPSSSALDRLALLVKELSQTETKEISAWGEKTMLWKDLPFLGPQVRELWDRDPSAGGNTPRATEVNTWMVSMQFIISLTREGVLELDHLALWSLRSALEDETVLGWNRDVSLSVATMWLVGCGGKIWAKCIDEEETIKESQKQYTKQGKLYEGPLWFCKGRWEFWDQRLEKLRFEGGLGEDVGERVDVALRAMKDACKN